MRVLPCECEASHEAIIGQLLRLLSGSAGNPPALQRPNTFATIARDKFAQKFLSLRRDTIARIFAQEFIAKSMKRRAIIHVKTARQFMNRDTDLGRALSCLLKNLLGAPVDSLEDLSVHSFQSDQIITTIVARAEDNPIPRQRKEFYSLGKILSRNGRTVRINQADGVEAALEQVLSSKIEALAETFATLWQQTEIGGQNTGIV